LSETRRIDVLEFVAQVKDGLVPDEDEHQCLKEVDARLHVIKLKTKIASEHANTPLGSLNRYKRDNNFKQVGWSPQEF
jgi:hypothetical protein